MNDTFSENSRVSRGAGESLNRGIDDFKGGKNREGSSEAKKISGAASKNRGYDETGL